MQRRLVGPERHDYEYERCGVCNVFLASEPLAGRRLSKVTERRTKLDWAVFVQAISASYPDAERITLVMDNLNTHTPGSLYEAFSPVRIPVNVTADSGNVTGIPANVTEGRCRAF